MIDLAEVYAVLSEIGRVTRDYVFELLRLLQLLSVRNNYLLLGDHSLVGAGSCVGSHRLLFSRDLKGLTQIFPRLVHGVFTN